MISERYYWKQIIQLIDAKGDNARRDFGEHIQVEFLYNVDNFDEVIFETTLAELKGMTPEAVNQNIFYPELGEKGLPVGDTHDLIVKFTFSNRRRSKPIPRGFFKSYMDI